MITLSFVTFSLPFLSLSFLPPVGRQKAFLAPNTLVFRATAMVTSQKLASDRRKTFSFVWNSVPRTAAAESGAFLGYLCICFEYINILYDRFSIDTPQTFSEWRNVLTRGSPAGPVLGCRRYTPENENQLPELFCSLMPASLPRVVYLMSMTCTCHQHPRPLAPTYETSLVYPHPFTRADMSSEVPSLPGLRIGETENHIVIRNPGRPSGNLNVHSVHQTQHVEMASPSCRFQT